MDLAHFVQVGAVMAPPIIFSIILHEVAHVWHTTPRRDQHPITVAGERGLAALAIEQGLTPRVEAGRAQDETLADACAFAWLNSGAGRPPARRS